MMVFISAMLFGILLQLLLLNITMSTISDTIKDKK